jgi:hypothetical protein
MPWVEVFAVFLVCHLSGDYLVQSDWEARHKRGGLGRDPVARRALFWHVGTYMLCFVPALVWLFDDLGWGVLWVAAVIGIPHLIQDDGRLLSAYMRKAKRLDPGDSPQVALAVDQTMHYLCLFGAALLVTAA